MERSRLGGKLVFNVNPDFPSCSREQVLPPPSRFWLGVRTADVLIREFQMDSLHCPPQPSSSSSLPEPDPPLRTAGSPEASEAGVVWTPAVFLKENGCRADEVLRRIRSHKQQTVRTGFCSTPESDEPLCPALRRSSRTGLKWFLVPFCTAPLIRHAAAATTTTKKRPECPTQIQPLALQMFLGNPGHVPSADRKHCSENV